MMMMTQKHIDVGWDHGEKYFELAQICYMDKMVCSDYCIYNFNMMVY